MLISLDFEHSRWGAASGIRRPHDFIGLNARPIDGRDSKNMDRAFSPLAKCAGPFPYAVGPGWYHTRPWRYVAECGRMVAEWWLKEII